MPLKALEPSWATLDSNDLFFFDLLEDQEEKVKDWNGPCARCRGGELQWRLESLWRRHLRVDKVSWCQVDLWSDRTCHWKEPGCNLHCCVLARTSGRAGWIGLGIHWCEQPVLTFCKSFGRFICRPFLQFLMAMVDHKSRTSLPKNFPRQDWGFCQDHWEKLVSRNCQTIHNLEHHFLCQNCNTFVRFTSASFRLQELSPVLDNYVIREAWLVANLKTSGDCKCRFLMCWCVVAFSDFFA